MNVRKMGVIKMTMVMMIIIVITMIAIKMRKMMIISEIFIKILINTLFFFPLGVLSKFILTS